MIRGNQSSGVRQLMGLDLLWVGQTPFPLAPAVASSTSVTARTPPRWGKSFSSYFHSFCNIATKFNARSNSVTCLLSGNQTGLNEKQKYTAVPSAKNISVAATRPQVVVTRETGKNGKLMKKLGNYGISCLELPLVEHIEGPELKRLTATLCDSMYDWIVITSPEAGLVFLDAWKQAGSPNVQIAVVGPGTASVFENIENSNNLLKIGFSPSKAIGRVLAAELPKSGETCTVLYPASVKARDEIEQGLSKRGFQVTRLNTYSTIPVRELNQALVAEAVSVPVVAVASPSAVRAWAKVLKIGGWKGAIACIGETSASAARESGFKKIYYPKNPGLEGWVESILEALRSQDSVQKVLTY